VKVETVAKLINYTRCLYKITEFKNQLFPWFKTTLHGRMWTKLSVYGHNLGDIIEKQQSMIFIA